MDFKKEIGHRIKAARQGKGWTLKELSRRTNDVLSDTRISNYETGERMPGPADAVILGKALGLRPAYIMSLDDAQLEITRQEEAMVRNLRKLMEKDRMHFVRAIEQMAMVARDTLETSGVRVITPKLKKAMASARKGVKP